MTGAANSEWTDEAAFGNGKRRTATQGLPSSRLWFSDREIEAQPSTSFAYTTDDFRRELARVERRLYWLTAVSIIVAIVAIVGIVGIVVQAG